MTEHDLAYHQYRVKDFPYMRDTFYRGRNPRNGAINLVWATWIRAMQQVVNGDSTPEAIHAECRAWDAVMAAVKGKTA